MTDQDYTERGPGSRSLDYHVADPAHLAVLQDAVRNLRYPLTRIHRNTGRRVPVNVADISRFNGDAGHEQAHREGVHPLLDARRQALGLYWLPTAQHPAGRIEVSVSIMGDPPLAQEVFIAELAHAVDYGVPLTDEQRVGIFAIVHGGDVTPHGTHGWWEERGGHNYWADWVGEVFMSLFMRAFAPRLSRPLEARQPWTHKVTDEMAKKTRRLLLVRP